ncbi:Ommochrome-binding protein [Operophtera brumata]|uniref:Ommochrome-binding protein n=1 Tax=Operophtera brumata TaxID=104452 RepID=A0A0L7L354_OPEBR|nr:Ommochrome-binding protein [Operophtera brumata]
MKYLILALFISSASAHCSGLFLNRKYYDVNIIKEGVNKIHEIVFNRNDNTAYFTFEQIAKVPTRALGYVKLDGNEAGVIDGIRNATGLAIDQALNRLYVGGSDGLYMINNNKKDKVPEQMPVNDDIRSLFIKDNAVYFVNRRREAFKFDFGYVNHVFELQGVAVDKLILDDDNNIMFLQNNKVFRVKIGTRIVNSHEKYVVNEIAADPHFKPYVCAKDGMYVYNKYKYALDKVGELKDVRKLAFITAEEPIYVVLDKIVRLVSNPVACLGN